MDIEILLLEYQLKTQNKNFTYKTLISYKCNIKAFLEHFKNKTQIEDITTKEMQEYLNSFNSINTRYVKINSLKCFYTIMGINTIDFDDLEKPKRIPKTPKKIDYNFLLERIDDIDNRKHKALLSLAFSTGMRITEILDLELKNIDFEKNKILVKGTKKTRTIIISDNLKKILVHYIKKFTPTKYLFNGQNSPQYSNRSAESVVKKCVGKEYNFHMIRKLTFIF